MTELHTSYGEPAVFVPLEHYPPGEVAAAADTVQLLAEYAIAFAAVERVPRYAHDRRENDAEHSYMLALVAPELAATYYPDLETGLVAQFGIVHDLVELQTQDIPTFGISEADLALKAANEHIALEHLMSRLPAHTASLLWRYEAQQEPEARFVRLIDKLLPLAVNRIGTGRQVMSEDYGVETVERLAEIEDETSHRLRSWFPETQLAFFHLVREALAKEFMIEFRESPAC